MQVKVNIQVSGVRNGQPWPPVGGVLEMSQEEALPLLQNGTVIPVHDPESGVELRVPVPPMHDVVVESDGHVDTSARDALVPDSKRTRVRTR